jgi:hypothetical protein
MRATNAADLSAAPAAYRGATAASLGYTGARSAARRSCGHSS